MKRILCHLVFLLFLGCVSSFAHIISGQGNDADADVNIALHKPATASSRYPHPDVQPFYVVDGSDSNVLNMGTCHHAAYPSERHPWWQVDLLHVYNITRLVIVGRNAAISRLHDFAIEVCPTHPITNHNKCGGLCYFYPGIFKPTTQTVLCNSPVAGRYVRLLREKTDNKHDMFTVCEVKVYSDAPTTSKEVELRGICTHEASAYFKGKHFKRVSNINKIKKLRCAVTCLQDPSCVGFNTGPLGSCDIQQGKASHQDNGLKGWKRVSLC